MALSSNLASIHSNSKYIERYMELKFEVHELSCLVGLQTTKESIELSKNLRESKSLKFLKNTFNGGLNLIDLDLACAWTHSNCLQERNEKV